MNLIFTEAQLDKFKALYKKHFNEELSQQDAYDKAVKLVRMMQIVYKPITQAQYDQVMARRRELALG